MNFSRRTLLQIATASTASFMFGTRFATAQASKTLRIGLSTYPAHLRPWILVGYSGHMVSSLINRNLINYDPSGQLVGELAESWTSESPTTWLFKLRPAMFHDGSPVTAEDVRWTFEQIAADNSGAYMYDGVKKITGFEVVDDLTFRLTTEAPMATLPSLMTYPFFSILKAGSTDAEDQGTGAGPYRIVSAEKGVGIELEPNEHYFKEGLPHLQSILITPYVDENARVAALTAGDVDLIDYVPWSAMKQIEANSALALDKVDSGAFMFLTFNGSGPFKDARLRQAVAFALKRNEFVESVFFGYGAEMRGIPRASGSPFWNEEQANYWGYDPDKARALLKEAGYEAGLKVQLLATSQYTMHRDTAVLVQSHLAEVGIEVELNMPDWATRVALGTRGAGDFAVQGFGLDSLDPDGAVSIMDPALSHAYSRSRDIEAPGLSDLLAQGRGEFDEAKRVEIYRAADQIALDNTTMCGVAYRATGFGRSAAVTPLAMLPDQLSPFSSVLFDKIDIA